jgi:hypothetical protein
MSHDFRNLIIADDARLAFSTSFATIAFKSSSAIASSGAVAQSRCSCWPAGVDRVINSR